MSLLSLALIGLVVLLSSFVSGVFGMAGGMILLGMLLVFFDVATAMVLFSVIVASANIWRVLMREPRNEAMYAGSLGAMAAALPSRPALCSAFCQG